MAPGNRVNLRPATIDDVQALAPIWRRGWEDGHLGNVADR
jgi:hypothetical protein